MTWLFTGGGFFFVFAFALFCMPISRSLFLNVFPILRWKGHNYVHVYKIAHKLEMYANDVQLALNCDAHGMDLVRAAFILIPLKLRQRVIFLRMHRRWLHYTKS